MAQELRVFDFEENVVRVYGESENPLFIARDVCSALGISNHRDTVSSLPEDEKDAVATTDSIGREQQMLAVTEPGLYRIIFQSRKPEAERFRRWVFHTVLPAIRMKGGYIAPGLTEEQAKNLTLEIAERRTNLVERKLRLLRELGQCDERDRLSLADEIRNPTGAEKNSAEQYITISSRATETGYRPTRSQLIAVGKLAAATHRFRHGCDPKQHNQYVDGAVRAVNTYNVADTDIVDDALQTVFENQ